MQNTKMIRILSRGIVTTSRGRVVGPVLNSYRENVQSIFNMLSQQPTPTIVEILKNGREVPLTLTNYDKDNELVKPDITPKSIVASVNKAEQADETSVVSSKQEQTYYQSNNKKRNRNRHNKGNSQQYQQMKSTESQKAEQADETSVVSSKQEQTMDVLTDDTDLIQ